VPTAELAALGTKVSAEKLLSIHRGWLGMKMETKLEAQMETQQWEKERERETLSICGL